MTVLRHTLFAPLFAPLFASLLVAGLGAGLATRSFAATEPAAAEAGGQEHGMGGPHDGFGGHGPGAPGPRMPFGHGLHRLQLTEAQQDKLFAIEHAAAPQRREQDKAIRKAHEALHELGRADRFDEGRAAAASRGLGQAVAAQALGEARLRAQVLALLTPEQREQLRRERPSGPPEQGGAPAHP